MPFKPMPKKAAAPAPAKKGAPPPFVKGAAAKPAAPYIHAGSKPGKFAVSGSLAVEAVVRVTRKQKLDDVSANPQNPR